MGPLSSRDIFLTHHQGICYIIAFKITGLKMSQFGRKSLSSFIFYLCDRVVKLANFSFLWVFFFCFCYLALWREVRRLVVFINLFIYSLSKYLFIQAIAPTFGDITVTKRSFILLRFKLLAQDRHTQIINCKFYLTF